MLTKIEVVPLKRRDLAHAKTEALSDADHRLIGTEFAVSAFVKPLRRLQRPA
ncbi:MAG TPA: hypothetical protein VIJ38_13485 [Acidobacteriaceae bacterium]